MPGKRVPSSHLLPRVVDIVIIGSLLLISQVYVDEARPSSEHNSRWQEARGISVRKAGYSNNNNHPSASQSRMNYDSTHHQVEKQSVSLPSNKDDATNRANSDDRSLMSMEGESSGDGSLDDHDSNYDNEEGDEDDYDDEIEEGIDPSSGNYEPKETIQSPTYSPSKDNQTLNSSDEDMPLQTTTTTLTSTPLPQNDLPQIRYDHFLPTTIKSEQTKVIPPTIQQSTTTTSSIFPNNIMQNLPNEANSTTTKRPWSHGGSTVGSDASSPHASFNSTYDYEDEDEDEEDEDDNNNSSLNFEDNSEPESNSDESITHLSPPTTIIHPTLQTMSTTTTTHKPITETKATLEIITTEPTVSTEAATITASNSNQRPNNINTTTPHEETDDDVETDGRDENVEDNLDDDDDDDDDDLDDDDMDDIDSDISGITANILDKQDSKFSNNTVDLKPNISHKNILDDSMSTTPNNFGVDYINSRGPAVITENPIDRLDESHIVPDSYIPNLVSRQKIFELRSLPLFAHPVIILLFMGSIVTGLYVAILIVMFIVYKLRRQEET